MKQLTTLSFLSLAILAGSNLCGQNLVPNPGFEVQDTCPAVSEIDLAPSWDSPTLGTPDLYNSTCDAQNLTAHNGVGSSGVYLLNTFANNREYIQAQLNAPLTAGQGYCVSFWVKRLNYRYASNRIGAYFSNGEVDENTTSVLAFTPQVDNPIGHMLSGNSWQQVSGSFTASGGETHILIGSFASDAQTDTLVANSGNNSKVSYYAIDDVSVVACFVGVEENANGLARIQVAPTPASDMVTISSEGLTILSADLFDLTGAMVHVSVVKMAGSYRLDVSDLSSGLYLVQVRTDHGSITERILVAR